MFLKFPTTATVFVEKLLGIRKNEEEKKESGITMEFLEEFGFYWLGADPNGGIFYGSDYFDKCYEYAEKLILEGKAYVDDLTRDEMREYRGSDAGKPSRPSPWRDRTPEENLDLFRRMRAGEFKEGEKTLRAKIDLASPNMNMRDPAIYVCSLSFLHFLLYRKCICRILSRNR